MKLFIKFWSHFNDEKNDPLYPFGYGLSYTEFEYSNLNIKKIGDRSLQVDFKVKNIGNLPGKEVIQLYIRDLFSSYTRPVKELKSFKKLLFKESEEKNISFVLNTDDLGSLNDKGELIFENGEFEIMVGGSSNTRMSQKITI